MSLGVWEEEAHKNWFSRMGKSKQSKRYMLHECVINIAVVGHLIVM